MAEEVRHNIYPATKTDESGSTIIKTETEESSVETQDRGLFDFLGKKKEENEPKEKVIGSNTEIGSEFEKVYVSEPVRKNEEYEEVKEEPKEEEKKHGLLEKLHRSGSSCSSSSDEEEVEEGGEKKKKKKLKDNIKEKISGDHKEEDKVEKYEETAVPIEKYEEPVPVNVAEPTCEPEEKKGFLEKIKDKLPGGHKKTEEVPPSPPPPPPAEEYGSPDGEAKEKKGFMEKIKEKIPGYHPKTEDEKEKGKEEGK
ncbi:unnamed protein product [Ilex paraguariensis]|uniref:Dehydrin n=1 Tax=Ilex paraguariensis TaxID=185542 RepID=A0ABC8UHA4_9AQUA